MPNNEFSQLKLLIRTEYISSIKSKSFLIVTFLMPLAMAVFGGIIGYLSTESNTLKTVANPAAPDSPGMTGMQIFGMLFGCLLTLFIMIYGAQIFTKVKAEKSNRLMEIIATCVTGRTMMLSKVIAVACIGITQILIWVLIIAFVIVILKIITPFDIPAEIFTSGYIWKAIVWSVLFFLGGYIFYGSLFAAIGALSDKNNENQEYMTLLTFILLGAFYISQYSVDHVSGSLAQICTYIPFTSASVSIVRTLSGASPLWETLLSVAVLYLFAWLSIITAGKLYTSGILLRGKKLTPGDFLKVLKMK